MKRLLLPLLGVSLMALVACDQANQNNASPSASALGSASATARATGSVAASATATASGTASTKYVDLKVVVPEDNAKAGVDGIGWTVDVIAKGNGPAMDKIKPAFTQSTSAGRNPAFPGLVVLLKSSSSSTSSGNANQNLAKLFQIVGLPNTLGGVAGISSVTASPAATASTGATGASGSTGASASPAGSAATRTTTTTDNETAEATWFVQQNQWGNDVDVELTVFVVDGDAPDTVSDRSSLKIVSNEVTVRFHINGGAAPSGTSRPSASPSPSSSAAPSSPPASPSASPSKTP